MIDRPHPRRHRSHAAVASAERVHGLRRPLASLVLLAAALTGCRHKAQLTLPQISLVPVALEVPPPSEKPLIIELPSSESEVTPPILPTQPPPEPARRRRPPVPGANPVEVANAVPAEEAIGELSSGGESVPQSRDQATHLIDAILKRLAALSRTTADQQRAPIRQVRNFVQQARKALASGDAEGARTLATKASLIMDDVEKK